MLKNNMFSGNFGWELSPVQPKWKYFSDRSFDRLEHGGGIARRRQATLDAPLGFLHVLGSDVLRLLGHIGLMLGNVRTVSNRHTDSNLQG